MIFTFGDCELDTSLYELRRQGKRCAIEPKAFDLLLCLLQNRNRLVSKDELYKYIWGNRIVSEATLNSCINSARKAIGDTGSKQSFIRTLPRRGYRFVAEVEAPEFQQERPSDSSKEIIIGSVALKTTEDGRALNGSTDNDLSRRDKPSIAVLPFDNLSADQEYDYFAKGVTENVITELSRYSELMVFARHSTFVFAGRSISAKQVGAELGARYVVEGSVRRSDNKVRVSAQLIDCITDTHLWAENFDGNLTDIFLVQDEITQSIAGALGSVVQDSEIKRAMRILPTSMAAYDRFLRAWEIGHNITRQSELAAMRELEEAIELDPRNARAYCALALFHCSSVWNGWVDDFDQALDQARECARMAVTLDPYDAWGHSFLGITELWKSNYDRALDETSKAIHLNPNFADGYIWLASVQCFAGVEGFGLDQVATARRLNPRAPAWYSIIEARGYFCLEKYVEALRVVSDVLEERPHFPAALAIAAASSAALDNYEQAYKYSERILSTSSNFRLSYANFLSPFKNQKDLNRFLNWAKKAAVPE